MPRSSLTDRSQVLPFEGATDLHQRIARNFVFITDWNAALAGHFELSAIVQILTRQIESYSTALFRLLRDDALPVASAIRPSEPGPAPTSSGALLRYLRDTRFDALQSGAIFRLSALRAEPEFADSPAASEWDARPDVIEVSVIILEAEEDRIDSFEIVFDVPPKRSAEIPPVLVTSALAYAWTLRSPGLISRLTRTRSRALSTAGGGSNILGLGNPCGLSRAELRVCQLVAAGDKAKEIAEVLGVSIATVRTHLRNIYAKTDTSGQIELVAVINAEKEDGA